jgi:1,4-alpha-glucan branching enzyme
MTELANTHRHASGLLERTLKQAARELLLAQSSDWAFIMKTRTMVDYAMLRSKEHLLNFNRLFDQIREGQIDEKSLSELESKNNIFPEIDYTLFAEPR